MESVRVAHLSSVDEASGKACDVGYDRNSHAIGHYDARVPPLTSIADFSFPDFHPREYSKTLSCYLVCHCGRFIM